MRAEPREAEYLAPLVKIIWPEHSLEDLAGIIREYMDSDESAVLRRQRTGSMSESRCAVCATIMWKAATQALSDILKV